MRKIFPAESRVFRDSATGRQVRQVTTAKAIHHHPFFLVPAYDAGCRWLFFVSHRLGDPQLFAEERASGRLIQLTEVPGLNEWSVHPCRSGRFVYFTTQEGGYRVDLASQALEKLVEFGGHRSKQAGMVAGGMGTTALSHCGRHWAIALGAEDGVKLHVLDTESLGFELLTEHDAIAHMQFCPDDSQLLFFAGNFKERLWTIQLDGGDKKQHYQREKGQWITHESWIAGRRELAFVDWPHAVRALDIASGAVRTIARFNAWHPVANDEGTMMITDTNGPDTGIHVFPVDGQSEPALVCRSEATNAGEHWHGPFPYEDGPIEVYAPQHTHPHPRFAPGGRHAVFTSDRTGVAQVYEATLEEHR